MLASVHFKGVFSMACTTWCKSFFRLSSVAFICTFAAASSVAELSNYQKAQGGGYGYIYDEPSFGLLGVILLVIGVALGGFVLHLNRGAKELEHKNNIFKNKIAEYFPLVDIAYRYPQFFLTDEAIKFRDLKIGQPYRHDKKEHFSFPYDNICIRIKVAESHTAFGSMWRGKYSQTVESESLNEEVYRATPMSEYVDVDPKTLRQFSGELDLADGNYKLFLQDSFKVKKNKIAGGFSANETYEIYEDSMDPVPQKSFSTAKEALKYCHQKYSEDFDDLCREIEKRNQEQMALFEKLKVEYASFLQKD